jgi:hypothetical protein
MTDVKCPDDAVVHPRVPSNIAGLAMIAYRVGDYTTFRRALLSARPNEVALLGWHPTASGDLAVQLLEWWAYLADILTFYNERALSEALLRTARQPENVRRIVRLLGYRPRPGIGATGVVAALTDSPRPFVLPHGMPIQGSVDSNEPPQVFELDDDVEVGLVGQRLRRSARFPDLPGRPYTAPVYPDRLANGQMRDWLVARSARRGQVPRLTAGKPVVMAFDGIVTNVAPEDVVVLMARDWDGKAPTALAKVAAIEPTYDDAGPFTKLTLHPGQDHPGGMLNADCQIMKPTKTAHLWLYHDRYPGPKLPSFGSSLLQGVEQFFDPGGLFSGGIAKEPPQDAHVFTSKVKLPVSTDGCAHLEGITRGINPGDPVLFAKTGGDNNTSIAAMISAIVSGANPAAATADFQQRTFFTKVTGYDELIWYANPPESDRIAQGPPIGPPGGGLLSSGPSPIPIPHSKISFFDPGGVADGMAGVDDANIKAVVVHYAWEEVAPIVEGSTTEPTTDPEIPAAAGVPPGAPAIIEDSTGAGTPGRVGLPGASTPPLAGPLRALLNLLPVSRGQTVAGEILGSGDPSAAGQEFVLARGPLTYLADTDPGPFDGYRSTLRVRVSGIEWHEVASFYQQPPGAHVFATREDEAQRTYVRFGDGAHGARLPAGADNVIADYRVGSGAVVPPIGALTTVLRPQPGLASIRNPIPPGGGADPDPPEQIRRYAPRSVLTFGRAVSGDDYETIAAQTPGVTRARAVWGWDATSQRSTVRVLVGDDAGALTAARDALRSFADPNRPVVVALATPVYADLSLTLEVDRDRDPEVVRAAVSAALLDPQAPPFGGEVARIGQPIYNSEIYEACLGAAGTVAVHGLVFATTLLAASPLPTLAIPGFSWTYSIDPRLAAASRMAVDQTERHVPGDDRYYVLRADRLHISAEVGPHGH